MIMPMPKGSVNAGTVITARRLLQAAIRRLTPLEHPSGYRAMHEGPELLQSAHRLIAEAVRTLESM